MTPPLRVDAGERGVEAILDALADGRSVVVNTEVLGDHHQVTLRHDGEQYYCDTPTTLHTHDSREEMRECIRKHGYASDAGGAGGGEGGTSRWGWGDGAACRRAGEHA